ncbi:MAG TPA: nitroreductase [Phycisphaerales bacterium]|nr:nitroreductase [Phycisphaerales bacterium]
MDFLDVIKSRRTVRLFKQDPIDSKVLYELVECARCAPAGANRQPLEYVIVNDSAQVERVFEHLAWAGYVKPKRTPPAGKRPVAYIVVLVNREISKEAPDDAAASIENILLAAWSLQIGSCWMGAVNREKIAALIEMPENYLIDSVVALGYPDEEPLMEDCKTDSIKYYLDANDRLHVPKRALADIVHENCF